MELNKKKKKKVQRVTKPYLRGTAIDKTTFGASLKIFFSTLFMTIAYMLVCSLMTWESMVLRITINTIILVSTFIIFHQSGASAGADAVNQGEIMYQRREKGRQVADWEQKMCYHPLKGFISAFIGSLPLLICSVILAIVAQRQMTQIGTLPSWVTALETREEIGNALQYYHVTGSITLESAMRLVVRMSIMPYVNMVGAANKDGMLLLERISPLLNLLPCIAYGLGYLTGVQIRSNVHTNIAIGKKKIKRKQQKERRARQQHSGPESLN